MEGLFPEKTRWKVSSKWATKHHECNLAGIVKRCGGRCCSSFSFWPPKAFGNKDGSCGRLGPTGCTFSPEDKPVVCHLYPLKLNKSGTLVVHRAAAIPKGLCCGNHGNGPMIIDVLKDSLIELFGEDQYDRVRNDIVNGRDSYFDVPEEVVAAVQYEERCAEENEPPVVRSQYAIS